jgi:phosphoglycolate phosphatase-like HAD superfamily hydrolase
MAKIIYTDVDSTVLDFNAKWEGFVRDRGIAIPHEGFLQGHCRLTDALGIDEAVEMKLVTEFFGSDHFYNLPAVEGAPEALQRLHSEGWRFVAVTACPNGEAVVAGRRGNLERALGVPFDAVHTTGVGGCKRDVLSMFAPTVWVEDHYQNAVTGHELGYRTFLIDQTHNRHHEALMTRVGNWSEIASQLCMER